MILKPMAKYTMVRLLKSPHATAIRPGMDSTSLRVFHVNTSRHPSVLLLRNIHFVSMEGNVRKMMSVIVTCRGRALIVNCLLIQKICPTITAMAPTTLRMTAILCLSVI